MTTEIVMESGQVFPLGVPESAMSEGLDDVYIRKNSELAREVRAALIAAQAPGERVSSYRLVREIEREATLNFNRLLVLMAETRSGTIPIRVPRSIWVPVSAMTRLGEAFRHAEEVCLTTDRALQELLVGMESPTGRFVPFPPTLAKLGRLAGGLAVVAIAVGGAYCLARSVFLNTPQTSQIG